MLIVAAVVAVAPARAWTPPTAAVARLDRGEVVAEVLPDEGRSTGIVHGAVDIVAPADVVWAIITDCAHAHRLTSTVKSCRILAADARAGWEVRDGVLDYGFSVPLVHGVVRSDYLRPRQISFHCLPGGNVTACAGDWRLSALPDGRLRVIYESWTAVPLPTPGFMIRARLKREITDVLSSLRRQATESTR
ncbi:MAG: SRPBCC family protein [Caulobacterales bacterium]